MGCIYGISDKILFNSVSFYTSFFFPFLILIYINNYAFYKKFLYALINVVICSV